MIWNSSVEERYLYNEYLSLVLVWKNTNVGEGWNINRIFSVTLSLILDFQPQFIPQTTEIDVYVKHRNNNPTCNVIFISNHFKYKVIFKKAQSIYYKVVFPLWHMVVYMWIMSQRQNVDSIFII